MPPAAQSADDRRVAAIAAAELLRRAGALLNEAGRMMDRMGEAEVPTSQLVAELREAVEDTEQIVNSIWGATFPFAGREYMEKLQAFPDLEGDLRASTCLTMGLIFAKALQCDHQAIEAVIANPEFSYQREAKLILQLRSFLSGGGEIS